MNESIKRLLDDLISEQNNYINMAKYETDEHKIKSIDSDIIKLNSLIKAISSYVNYHKIKRIKEGRNDNEKEHKEHQEKKQKRKHIL